MSLTLSMNRFRSCPTDGKATPRMKTMIPLKSVGSPLWFIAY